jgi:hypothetical protein
MRSGVAEKKKPFSTLGVPRLSGRNRTSAEAFGARLSYRRLAFPQLTGEARQSDAASALVHIFRCMVLE